MLTCTTTSTPWFDQQNEPLETRRKSPFALPATAPPRTNSLGAKTLCVHRLPSHQETATLDPSGPSREIVFTASRDTSNARARVLNDFKKISREYFEGLIVRQQGDRTETVVIRRSRHDRD